MSTDPDQIRQDIEATRNNLSSDVDALAYKVSPSRIVDDRKQRVRSALTNVKDKVMGTASDLGHSTGQHTRSVGDHASSAASTVSDKAYAAASTVGDAAQRAPQVLREKSEGNPIAAGVIAFGLGMLVSSLIPATRREQQMATQVREKATEHSGVVKEKLGEVASEIKEELRGPAEQAAQSVKSTAQDAAQTVKEDSRSAAHDVKGSAQQSREQARY